MLFSFLKAGGFAEDLFHTTEPRNVLYLAYMSLRTFFSFKRPRVYAVVLVGTDAIRALVFEYRDGAVPHVLLRMGTTHIPRENSEHVVTKLRELLFRVTRALQRVPDKVVVAFTPGFAEHSLATWVVRGGFVKSSSPSSKELATYFHNLFVQHQENARGMLAYPLDVLVNGYVLNNRVSRGQIQELGFLVLTARLSESVGTALYQTRQSLGGLPLEFVPLVACYDIGFHEIKQRDEDGTLLVDIGDSETTLAFWKEGALAGVTSFPRGVRGIIKEVASNVGLQSEDVSHWVTRLKDNALIASVPANIRAVFEKEISVWQKQCDGALARFASVGPLSSRVFITGTGAEFSLMREVVQTGGWLGALTPAEHADVQVLSPDFFFGGHVPAELSHGPEDTGLAALMVYATARVPLFAGE